MANVDIKWALAQLQDAGYSPDDEVTGAVELLLREFNIQDLDAAAQAVVLDLFNKLAYGLELVGRDVQTPGATWETFHLGEVDVGATIRVRLDAYRGAAGTAHNGKVGHLVGARGGKAIVQYANATDNTGHRHLPSTIEVLRVSK